MSIFSTTHAPVNYAKKFTTTQCGHKARNCTAKHAFQPLWVGNLKLGKKKISLTKRILFKMEAGRK